MSGNIVFGSKTLVRFVDHSDSLFFLFYPSLCALFDIQIFWLFSFITQSLLQIIFPYIVSLKPTYWKLYKVSRTVTSVHYLGSPGNPIYFCKSPNGFHVKIGMNTNGQKIHFRSHLYLIPVIPTVWNVIAIKRKDSWYFFYLLGY